MDDKSRFGLTEPQIEAIQGVLALHTHVEKAVLYGSRAMGNFRPGSDIDLVLMGDQLSLDDVLAIANELDDLLLPYKIDLSSWHDIDQEQLLDHIARKGIVFYLGPSRETNHQEAKVRS